MNWLPKFLKIRVLAQSNHKLTDYKLTRGGVMIVDSGFW